MNKGAASKKRGSKKINKKRGKANNNQKYLQPLRYIGRKRTAPVKLNLISYNAKECKEKEIKSVKDSLGYIKKSDIYSFLAIQRRDRPKGKFNPDIMSQFSNNKKQAKNLLIELGNGLRSDLAILSFFKNIPLRSLIILIKGNKNVFL